MAQPSQGLATLALDFAVIDLESLSPSDADIVAMCRCNRDDGGDCTDDALGASGG